MLKPLAFVFGTRPEIIKLAPLFREVVRRDIRHLIIHTNQHYSAELDTVFFEELELPLPTHNLHVGPGTQTAQTARMMTALEPILLAEDVGCVIVQGDTNSVLTGALVAAKLNIPIAHVEAGLRSYDRLMPEETNRIITDHISTYLFPPTAASAEILEKEGIDKKLIHTVGNTVVDSVLQGVKLSESIEVSSFGLQPQGYFFLTLHRPANVDAKEDLLEIMAMLETIHAQTQLPFFLPLHPRTEGNIKKFGLTLPKCIITHGPVGYRDCLALEKNSAAIFTDSGGIQEEACILGVPCITLRDSTERPETITVGGNFVVFRDAAKALSALEHFKTAKKWPNPFGDGTTGQKIIDILTTESA
jgi:UDP-N-acetylglucosamine 2-epimerase (non-hydrolysing)